MDYIKYKINCFKVRFVFQEKQLRFSHNTLHQLHSISYLIKQFFKEIITFNSSFNGAVMLTQEKQQDFN